MRAAVLTSTGNHDLEVRSDVEVVEPQPDEVTIRVKASGVCHSDLSAMNGSLWIPLPAVMGHEAAGVVEATGFNVQHVAAGDHVVVAVSTPCGGCKACTVRGMAHLCEQLFFEVASKPRFTAGSESFAAMGAIGSFAERVTVRKEAVIPIPKDVPFEVAALLGCGVTSGVGAVLNTARVTPGSSVVVLGVGGVGTAAIQGARVAGADLILAVDVRADRAANALSFGATHCCTAAELPQVVKNLTGDGFDYAFESAGSALAMRAAYDSIHRGGTACIIGFGAKSETLSLSASEIYFNEKRLIGSYHGSADFRVDTERNLRLWRDGSLQLDEMITHRFALEAVNDAIDAMRSGNTIRSVVLI